MAEFSFSFFPFPHLSNSLSPPPVVSRPGNPTHSSILSPLLVFNAHLSSSDSETDASDCELSFELEPTTDYSCHYDGYGHDDDDGDDEVSFITNLFFRSPAIDPDCGDQGSAESEGIGESTQSHSELGLGLGLILNVDSASDNESLGAIGNVNHWFGMVSNADPPPCCWDYLGLNNRANDSEKFGLEKRDCTCLNHEREIELSSIVIDDDNDDDYGVDLFFCRFHDEYDDDNDGGDDVHEDEISLLLDTGVDEREAQELPTLSDTYEEREELEIVIRFDTNEVGEYGILDAIRDLEWEILLALDNFRREIHNMDFNTEPYGLDFNEDAYEAVLVDMEERMNEWERSPPTAKSTIENLPTVSLSAESLVVNENDACAICKDGISGEETLRQLPCLHYYHGHCILPWLKMHNTCPLCRYELPTDDPEYEHRK